MRHKQGRSQIIIIIIKTFLFEVTIKCGFASFSKMSRECESDTQNSHDVTHHSLVKNQVIRESRHVFIAIVTEARGYCSVYPCLSKKMSQKQS